MAEQLTKQQSAAVHDRGGKLLVSAAAGSGKTKVLVDRLLTYLTDPADPANLDDFLIITYTKAAAAELRGKIETKLTQRIGEEPGSRHLQQQLQRLYLAKISTVHGFCSDLLREYAYRLDISPDFRVGDENECRELREWAMTRALDGAYAGAGENEDFRIFIDTQGLGRDDRLVPQIVEKVYNSARCHLKPEAWLEQCMISVPRGETADAGTTPWGMALMAQLKEYLAMQITAMDRCAQAAAQVPEFANVAALLSDTVWQLRKLADCSTWDEIVNSAAVSFGRLTFPRKNGDPILAEQIKAVRSACKEGLEKHLKAFADLSAQIWQDMEQTAAAARGLVGLVRSFEQEYDRLKRQRRLLDFSDLEHKTLDLLLGTGRTGPTRIAREVGDRFREIMVDEYQDSNAVQDAIFSALTAQRNNCFMVGDVKQSIYQFRLADPGIFLQKYHDYVPAETAQPGQGRRIVLSSNFRSGGAVLEAVNDVFRACMSPQVGGLHYGEEEALSEGIPHAPLGEPEVEFYAIDVQQDTYREEASFVASRIRELLDGSHMVRQGDASRPILPEDIVILLRSPGSVGTHFIRALADQGIRCTTGGGYDLLQTGEIMTLRSLLQTVGNPRQDIPLMSVLASPVFCFTADELAHIRAGSRELSLYDSLLCSDSSKAAEFVRVLTLLREKAGMDTLANLLQTVFTATHLDSVYSVMPDGDTRAENLRSFFQLAVDFEANGRRTLSQFLEYLDRMEEKGLIIAGSGETAGSVSIMSIHSSKGLEYPVVFLCGLARRFNKEDLRAQVLCHKELGLGLSVMDRKNRVRYPTIARRAIADRAERELLSEELRVLYVAMTRARDRLIMTYANAHLDRQLSVLSQRMDMSPPELLTGGVSCPGEWILLTALGKTEAGDLFARGDRPAHTVLSAHPWHIAVCAADTAPESGEDISRERENRADSEQLRRMAEFLNYAYPYPEATQMPSKRTVTQLKGREKDQEAAENTAQIPAFQRNWRRPAFTGHILQGKEYGNAVHTAMQYLRYEACTSDEKLERELERIAAQGFLTAEQAAAVDRGRLMRFFRSDLGRRLSGGEQVLREFKFSLLVDGKAFSHALTGEQVLLQGVVDCALIGEEGITVLDFKTDRVTEKTLDAAVDRYRGQINAYADALSRIFEKQIQGKYLYFFHPERLISV